ncbi:MAG: GDSL-type esterase/lipase family protein [Solirubrobacteraceae bacterium]
MPALLPRRRRTGVLLAAAAAATLAAAGSQTAVSARAAATTPSCPTATHWVAAWSADPSGLLGSGFVNQTLRIILTPHIGAGEVRVHLSNRLGGGSVRFARASIARRQGGAELVPGSSRQLTFGGAPAVIIPAGGEVTSDPAPLPFAAFQDLAVSLYLPDAPGPASGHLVGRERSYATARAGGDHTADGAAGAFGASTTSVPYVDAVDGLAPAAVGAAVLFGDSIIDGYESVGLTGVENVAGIDANRRFPDYLARRLLAEPGGPRLSVLNAGISGNRLLSGAQQTIGGASALSRLEPDVLGVAGATDAIVLEGTNDIVALATVNQVTTALAQIVARLHAGGIHVVLGTIIPVGAGLLGLGNVLPTVYVDSPINAVRVAVNAWIRSGASGADRVVDFDAALRGRAQPNVLDPAFDSGDHVHPSDAGYSRMADAVDLAALRGVRCAPAPASIATRLHIRARAHTAGRVHLSGTLRPATPTACTGARLTVRAVHAGRTILRRSVPVTPACHVGRTLRLGARGEIEIRVSFAGSPPLLPTRARSIFLRAS